MVIVINLKLDMESQNRAMEGATVVFKIVKELDDRETKLEKKKEKSKEV